MANATPANSSYIALTTYRRDGRPVTTPVWSAPLEGNLYVVTAESTGKARRLRATGRVRFAACNRSGRHILGEWHEGTGRIVQDEARCREALAALQRKYGWQLSLAMLIYRLRGLYRDRLVLELAGHGRLALITKGRWFKSSPATNRGPANQGLAARRDGESVNTVPSLGDLGWRHETPR